MINKKFKKLEKKIEHEYEHEGFGHKRAEYIGRATAGKIAREKKDPPRHQEPYGHLNLSQEPSMYLASEQKKINGKLSGGYDLDFKL